MSIKHYCDKCSKEFVQKAGTSMLVSIALKMLKDNFRPIQEEQEFCEDCTSSIKEFIDKNE
jgi:hypothetical protein